MTVLLGLLRGVNVGGHKRVPMAELRELCAGLGFERARTYIQSGNVVFASRLRPAAAENRLAAGLERRFGFPVAVVVRTLQQWRAHERSNPLRELAAADPSHVLLGLASKPVPQAAAAELQEHCRGGERVEVSGGALYIHYAGGIARSKLTPARIDRCAGSSVTARNWRTVLELGRLAGQGA